jgi:hypothetical protein
MALIADLCPQCQRITRCQVVERGAIVGGLLLGIPLVLPLSSVSCTRGECGFEFRSEFWDHRRTASPAEAGTLDIEALLAFTNPGLKEKVTLSGLQAIPRLSGAFQLLDQLRPGSLRTALKDALLRWSSLNEGQQVRFLANVDDCSQALRFARLMAGRYTFGAVGCLLGILGCVGVWSGCLLVLGSNLNLWGWVAVVAGGFLAGGLLSALFRGKRDRRWVKEVLLLEAGRSGIRPAALLAVLEGGGPSNQVEDELNLLRQLAPALRAELAPSGKAGDETVAFAFAAPSPVFRRQANAATAGTWGVSGGEFGELAR